MYVYIYLYHKYKMYYICNLFLPTEGMIILELKGTPTTKSEVYTDEQIKNELSLE